MKTDQVYIDQIKDSVRKIEKFLSGISREEFFKDEKTQSSVILQLALIGEVSKKISEMTKSKIDLPWKDIAGFRDRAIHDYFDIDLEIIWNTVKEDIPVVKSRLK